MTEFEVGDLVRLRERWDKQRSLGIIIEIEPVKIHMKSAGPANLVKVYWPAINLVEKEYTFFLIKLEGEHLTGFKN